MMTLPMVIRMLRRVQGMQMVGQKVMCLACTVVVRFLRGGLGTVTWQPSPRGWWGTVFPGWGRTRGVGGTQCKTTHCMPWNILDPSLRHADGGRM